MKKLALLLVGLGSFFAVSLSTSNYASAQSEPQYQEQCAPVAVTDTVCNQLPCNVPANCTTPVTCSPDTVCAPAPACAPAPVCAPGC